MSKFCAMGRIWHVDDDLRDYKKQLNQVIFMVDKSGVIQTSLRPLKNISLSKSTKTITTLHNLYLGKYE